MSLFHKSRTRYFQKAKILLRVFQIIRPYRKSLVVLFVLMITGTCFGLVGPYMSKLFIDVVFKPNAATGRYDHAGLLIIAVGIMFGAQAIQQVLAVLRARFSARLGNTMLYDIRAVMFERLQHLSLSFFDKQQTGALISRVNQDTAELQRFMVDFFPVTLESLLLLTGAAAFLFIFNWQLTLIVAAPLWASALFLKKMYLKMGVFYRDYFERRSKLSAQANDAISGIRVIKVFGQEPREITRFNEKNAAFRDAGIGLARQTSVYSPAFTLIIILATSAVWMAGGELVLLKKMTLGSIIAFLGYLAMFYRPVMTLGNMLGNVASSLSVAQRVFEIIDAEAEILDIPGAKTLSHVNGKVELRNVSLAYGEKRVIEKCDCIIEAGSMVAIVGKSGAGKSTIANAVCRLYDVAAGAVLIDDVDIKTLKIEDVHKHIGLISQETFLFDGTILENIAYAKPAALKEEVITAAKIACAHEFIMTKPGNYEAVVGERGVMLSGGEKQRIAIARAVLHDPAILVLDEATSAIDTNMESEIFAALGNLTRKRTIICIAHRLPSPERFEKVFVMDYGAIVEVGTHTQLMAKKGAYFHLCSHHETMA